MRIDKNNITWIPHKNGKVEWNNYSCNGGMVCSKGEVLI